MKKKDSSDDTHEPLLINHIWVARKWLLKIGKDTWLEEAWELQKQT